jgi:hypothetical protein
MVQAYVYSVHLVHELHQIINARHWSMNHRFMGPHPTPIRALPEKDLLGVGRDT